MLFAHLQSITESQGYAYMTLPRERPALRTEIDNRHFTLYTKEKIESIARKRRWEIVWFDVIIGSNSKPIWNSFIVKFPKK
jgi:hypothetical protein